MSATTSTSRVGLQLEQLELEGEASRSNKDVQNIFCNNFGPVVDNPMMNDLILEHLSNVVSYSELATFRQVCKHWYYSSLASWLKNGPPIVLKDEDWNDFKDVIIDDADRGRPSRKLSEIVGIQRYPKFSLKGSTYGEHLNDMFWNSYGPWLTHLTINYDRCPGVVRFLNLLTCKFTPNLAYLEVECIRVFEKEEKEDERRELPMDVVAAENKNLKEFRIDYADPVELPMDWKTLLSHYPKLEHFSIGRCLSFSFGSQMEEILIAIREIRKEDREKLNLKSLAWYYNMISANPNYYHYRFDPLSPAIARLFRESKLLRIETFRMYFRDEDSDECVNSILSTFASSLRELEFYRFSLLTQLPFRNMDQLRRLTLSGYPVANLLFLTELPNLRSLTLWGNLRRTCSHVDSMISATNVPQHLTFPSINKFSCNYKEIWTDADLSQMQELMPNLTQLELELCNPTFRLVCQLWPRLEHLCVFGGGIGDAGIVGLDKDDGPEIVYNQPNVTNLTELKSFIMDNDHDVYATTVLTKSDFSEHTVLGGFRRLPQLQRLDIINIRVDPLVADLLRRNIPFAKVNKEEGLFPISLRS